MTIQHVWCFLAVACFCSRFAGAIKWNVTSSIASPLTSWMSYPPDNPGCTVPGVCGFYNTTIPANTLWYWCGWSTKERTEYWVTSATVNISVMLMREKDVYNCALTGLATIKGCYVMSDSLCDTSTNCYNKIYGFSFVDPVCVLIANNDKKAADVSLQVWQYYDSRRYYGTAFSILLLIICLGFAFGQMGYTCYHQIKKPNHRLDELEKATRDKLLANAVAIPTGRDASEAVVVTPGPRVSLLMSNTTNSAAGGIEDEPSVGNGSKGLGRASNGAGVGVTGTSGGVGLIDRMKNMVSGGETSKRGHEH